MDKFSYLKSTNADYIDELLEKYSRDPDSIDPSWKYFFDGIELGSSSAEVGEPLANGHSNGHANGVDTSPAAGTQLSSETQVIRLIAAYREAGKLIADINPLSAPPSSHPRLELSAHGLTNADLSKTFAAGRLIGMGDAKLSEIVARLKEIYCSKVAVEISHISRGEELDWIQKKLESPSTRAPLDAATRKQILKRLSASETFERFLHTRYVAQKRFSIEGGEALIPALDCVFSAAAELGAREFVIGMAHRGRLNVLTNVMGKKPEFIFTEFEGQYKADKSLGEGDVKYHMGFSADVTTRAGKSVHLSLGSNPSHLEFINPVAEGVAYSKQKLAGESGKTQIVPVLIHGDAAFAGQGVCYETLNLSLLRGYGTGGTLHFVINNQVGFTTSPIDSRSTQYCTDLAKMLETPIFHVNGDDVESLWRISEICAEYRQKFGKDIFVDIVCYRKHGHNEGDEPSFTQPLMYKQIKTHPSPREIYSEKLVQAGVLAAEEAQKYVDEVTAQLTEAQTRTKAENPKPYVLALDGRWKGFRRPVEEDFFKPAKTAVDAGVLKSLAEKLNSVPSSFHLHPKLVRFFEGRMKAVQDGKGIDWGNAETLAYASLVNEGTPVRLSGQDAERGTFTHRHSVLNDYETGETYTPLNHLSEKQARYCVHNSHLSETAVLGFEYGYSLADPKTLVAWEAQFGDFANGAQVIIDQFIAGSESKWQRMSGLVLLLPHGFEGQGPEHSSARLERFLQLSGRLNMQVMNLSTPAQIFHALRRQIHRDFRKPMIVMSPKSLLRHPMAVSTLDELSQAGFMDVLDDPVVQPAAARKVVLCSGKVYYDFLAERTARKISDIALVRVEQLYPWPKEMLAAVLKRYSKAKTLVWAQEEPRNMGAWTYVFALWAGGSLSSGGSFADLVDGRPIQYVGREICAAPAVGSHKLHESEQHALIDQALS